jgi:hypothetical protein
MLLTKDITKKYLSMHILNEGAWKPVQLAID